jgi:MraZ protein
LFRGRYEHTIDDKGRISIPVKFREILNDKFDERLVITNIDNCLAAFPYPVWSVIEEKVQGLSVLKREANAFLRFFYSSAIDCVVDKQGRLLIPPTLREYADLRKEVMLVGEGKKIEIWSKERWLEVERKAQEIFEQIRDTLADAGI